MPNGSNRSEEVQEIMSRVPHWMIRWGITLIFALILLFIGLCWMIKYPDVIKGTITISTDSPPVELNLEEGGFITDLRVKEGMNVKAGDKLMVIKSELDRFEIEYIDSVCAQVESALDKEEFHFTEFQNSGYTLGPLQEDFDQLIQSIHTYQELLRPENYTAKKKELKSQINTYQQLSAVLNEEIALYESKLDRSDRELSIDQKLKDDGVLSGTDLTKSLNSKEDIQERLLNLKRSKLEYKVILSQLRRELSDLDFEQGNSKREILIAIEQSVGNLRNGIENWEFENVISSPVDGTVSFKSPLKEGQFIKQNAGLFAIIPSHQEFVALMTTPKNGIGKVEVGQDVKVSIDNYPSHEFGQLRGKVKRIAPISGEEGYQTEITLPNGLITTYGQTLDYQIEMTGNAEIITEDLRITDRIFNQFRSLFE